MQLVLKLLFSLIIIFHGVLAYAWSAAGHLISAQIAYDQLTPNVKARAEQLIAVTSEQYPNTANFITASLWADDLKSQGDKRYNALHYINLYINMKGERIDKPVPSPNVITAIQDAKEILQDNTQSKQAQSLALRGLIHWVGDIHQPLHCVSRIGPAWPQGDRGGTGFPLPKKSGYRSLHAYWDNGLNGFPKLKRPKTAAQIARLQNISRALVINTKLSSNAVAILDPEQWAQESLELAVHNVYPHIYPNQLPSNQYHAQGEIIARQQVVLAGLRLAALLNEILK